MTMGRRFGVWVPTFLVLCLVNVVRAVVTVGLALDHVFFPRFRRARIDRPIVIVGNPRTGTTFLQRFLTSNGVGAGLETWQMLYPSLTLQKLIRPLLPRLEKLSPAGAVPKEVHETSLTSVETDDASLTYRFFDGIFVYGYALGWAEKEYLDLFDPAVQDSTPRDAAWLRKIWRRNLTGRGQSRVIAKLFSLTGRLPAFLKEFPDARVLYMVRDPVAVVPSTLSLVTGIASLRLAIWEQPEAVKKRYFERLYHLLVEGVRRFHDDYFQGRIPKDRVLIVRYDRLMQDFETVMDEIFGFTGIEPTAELRAKIVDRAVKQRAYKSEHRYDLAKFGLDEARIRKDCAFMYEAFLPPLPAA